MTQRERIMQYIAKHPGMDDDEIATALQITPRQAVNQACRSLQQQGLLLREQGPSGKICNFSIAETDPADEISQAFKDKVGAPPAVDRFTPFAALPDLGDDAFEIARLAARHCLLPHPKVVEQLPQPVFPTVRHQQRRGEIDRDNELLLDDNVTPRWALLWAHNFTQTHHPKGWTFAHVWAAPKDPQAYTRLANIVMMPEALASLSDKQGPLVPFLQYHAFSNYGWKPDGFEAPLRPDNFDKILWNYLTETTDPMSLIRSRMASLGNQRVVALRELMGL